MKKLKIAIVDDEDLMLTDVKSKINDFCNKNRYQFDINTYISGNLFFNTKGNQVYDIIFLDIELGDSNGIDIAKKIRETDSKSIIIFITRMPQYAVEGYKVDALDYIVKPIKYYDLELTMRRALSRIKRDLSRSIILNVDSNFIRVELSEIHYVEVLDHYVTYHLENSTIRIKKSLNEVEQEINSHYFIRCKRCYLINISKISEIKDNEIFIGNRSIQLSRGKRKEVLNAFTDYLGGSI